MSVLGKAELARMLGEGGPGREKIFERGTWDKDSLRAAAYDLRIAADWLITPGGTRYWPNGQPDRKRMIRPFHIKPGEVAFVSSVEEMRMPRGLAANIAVRFHSALEGIFVMGGLLVDPGYRGRLHFQLANIGDKDFIVVPEETSVAALQFMLVDGPADDKISINDSTKLLRGLFYEGAHDPLPPLSFFSDATTARQEIAVVKKIAEDQEAKVEATKRSTDQLVVFGVFLISASLFTAALAALISALATHTYEKAGKVFITPSDWKLTGVVGAAAVLVAIIIAFFLMLLPVWRIVRKTKSG
jgi:deoxycytidine triphosphate deaminase